MRPLCFLGTIDVPAQVAAVPRARGYVRALLEGIDHPHTDDALLLVSELVTNSVRHSDSGHTSGGRITIAVAHHDGTLHVDIIDAGSTTGQCPQVRTDVTPDSGGGRGLHLVQELSTVWGWHETPTGRVTWFQLAGK